MKNFAHKYSQEFKGLIFFWINYVKITKQEPHLSILFFGPFGGEQKLIQIPQQ